jgi:hypothetical protein
VSLLWWSERDSGGQNIGVPSSALCRLIGLHNIVRESGVRRETPGRARGFLPGIARLRRLTTLRGNHAAVRLRRAFSGISARERAPIFSARMLRDNLAYR